MMKTLGLLTCFLVLFSCSKGPTDQAQDVAEEYLEHLVAGEMEAAWAMHTFVGQDQEMAENGWNALNDVMDTISSIAVVSSEIVPEESDRLVVAVHLEATGGRAGLTGVIDCQVVQTGESWKIDLCFTDIRDE